MLNFEKKKLFQAIKICVRLLLLIAGNMNLNETSKKLYSDISKESVEMFK